MVNSVALFMKVAGTLPGRGEFSTRQTALQIGLILEEVAELLYTLPPETQTERGLAYQLDVAGNAFKSGVYDVPVSKANKLEMLDAFVDIRYVATGGGLAMGSDMQGACAEVAQNNLSKFPPCTACSGKGFIGELNKPCKNCSGFGLVSLKDPNGKVIKREGYQKVDLTSYV